VPNSALHPDSAPFLPFPSSAICLITDTIGGVQYRGSGVIIGPHTILTAAHMVWSAAPFDPSTGQTATNISIYPGYESGSASVSGAAIHYNPINDVGGYLDASDGQNDFAIIDVTQD